MLKRYLFIFTILLLSYAKLAYAQETEASQIQNDELPIFETDVMEKINLLEAPQCDNPLLFKKVLQKVMDYAATMSTGSTINKRKKALILANINSFEKVDVKNISPETDLKTANALITIKVNKNIDENDFTICKQVDSKGKPLYLIIYPYMDNFKVHIINLDSYSDDYEKISFTYP